MVFPRTTGTLVHQERTRATSEFTNIFMTITGCQKRVEVHQGRCFFVSCIICEENEGEAWGRNLDGAKIARLVTLYGLNVRYSLEAIPDLDGFTE